MYDRKISNVSRRKIVYFVTLRFTVRISNLRLMEGLRQNFNVDRRGGTNSTQFGETREMQQVKLPFKPGMYISRYQQMNILYLWSKVRLRQEGVVSLPLIDKERFVSFVVFSVWCIDLKVNRDRTIPKGNVKFVSFLASHQGVATLCSQAITLV